MAHRAVRRERTGATEFHVIGVTSNSEHALYGHSVPFLLAVRRITTTPKTTPSAIAMTRLRPRGSTGSDEPEHVVLFAVAVADRPDTVQVIVSLWTNTLNELVTVPELKLVGCAPSYFDGVTWLELPSG
jgi:hypothetical protein